MAEDDDEGRSAPPSPTPTSKAGRNEGRKLMATLFNNFGLAVLLAAFVQPLLAVLRDAQAFGFEELRVSLALAFLGAIFIRVAQAIAQRLED